MIGLIIVLLLLFVLGFIPFLRAQLKSRQINNWRRVWNINKHQLIFKKIYQDVDGYALSRSARLGNDAMEYVYGEIEFEPYIALLAHCKPNQNTVFYDLGSGVGKAVLACAMVFEVQKGCGIEVFSLLHHAAVEQKVKLGQLLDYQKQAEAIVFFQGNFLDFSFTDASLIFINSTAFFGEHWQKISEHLEQTRASAMVVSISKPLLSSKFILKKKLIVQMSWGLVDAYIQERLSEVQ